MAQAKKALSKSSGKNSSRNGAGRTATKTYQNYIDGKWVASQSGEMFENINPADTRDIVGRFPLSTSDDVTPRSMPRRMLSIAGATRPLPSEPRSCFASERS